MLGLVGLIVVLRLFAHGWIGELYVEQEYHFSCLGFGWVKPWPGWGMYLHLGALGTVRVRGDCQAEPGLASARSADADMAVPA